MKDDKGKEIQEINGVLDVMAWVYKKITPRERIHHMNCILVSCPTDHSWIMIIIPGNSYPKRWKSGGNR